jgi:peptidoglycan/xylan/chitin deacetylase (PgdA/CDA1 family)
MRSNNIHKIFGDKRIVPAVMFHSVGHENSSWIFSHLSDPRPNFEDKIYRLKKAGFTFIFWSDLYDYMAENKKIQLPAVMLTFDDGYLDNWVYAYPVLKKHDVKATIFINPEFVEPSSDIRENLEGVWSGTTKSTELLATGFLNWKEMQQMEASGLIDIQSHSMTHTWYFSGPSVIDFHRPGLNKYPWVAWNERPERKPYYLTENQTEFIPLGMPIYEYDKALVCKRYFPPEKIAVEITKWVASSGGDSFFQNSGWKNELIKLHDELTIKYGSQGHFESNKDYSRRVFLELKESKKIIEKKLDKHVDFLCWPGGAYNPEVLSLAKKAGYKAWTLGSRDQSSFRNIAGAEPTQIKRVGSAAKQIGFGRDLGYTTGREFLLALKRHQGSFVHKIYGRLLKMLRYING